MHGNSGLAPSPEREGQFEQLVEAMPDAVLVVDEEGVVRAVNGAALALFGRARDDFVGENLAFTAGGEGPAEITLARASGPRICEMRVADVPWQGDACQLAAIRDVTERRLAEQALRESETHFAVAQRIAAVGSFVMGLDGRIVSATDQLHALFGFDAGSGERWDAFWEDTVAPEHRAALAALGRNALGGGTAGSQRIEFPFRRGGDEAFRTALVEIDSARDADGEVASLLGVARDVTDLRLAEAKARQLNAELERRVAARTDELSEANRELEAFAHTVGHDLRTPLRAIDWLAQSIADDVAVAVVEQVTTRLDAISDCVGQASRLIDDLLVLSKVGRRRLQRERIDLDRLVGALCQDLRHASPGVEITFALEPLGAIEGDLTMVRQVFQNLVDNAVKFRAPDRPARVRVARARVAQGRTATPVFCVEDNGRGFDMAQAERLFGVFERAESPDATEGTGIGLAIVRRVVARHGGRVWARSAPGSGARFYFTLEPDPDVSKLEEAMP